MELGERSKVEEESEVRIAVTVTVTDSKSDSDRSDYLCWVLGIICGG
jgi:hypothetical protein